MKGQIPVTYFMILESEEAQWSLLTKGIINELKTSGLIEVESGRKIRIRLVIERIISPENVITENSCYTESNFNKEIATGISRSKEFLVDFLDKKTWMFLGYIEGEEKKPILITYYQSINITIYTQKLKEEERQKFFPHQFNSLN